LGKGANEDRAEAERRQHAQEEDDVSRRSEEDCRSPKAQMGEGQNRSEEVGLTDTAAFRYWWVSP